jgi:hypothetical protein
MPADVVVGLACGVCDPSLHFESDGEARQRISTGDRPGVGDGQYRGPHRTAAVHRRSRRVVDVVEVEHVARERIEERGKRRRDALAGPDYRCPAAAFALDDGVSRAPGGVVGRSAHRHPDVVDEGAPRRMQDRFGDLLALVLGDEAGQKRCWTV